MTKKICLMACLFLLAACTAPAPPVMEPTIAAPTQPIEATRTIPQTFTSAPRVKTPTSTLPPSSTPTILPTQQIRNTITLTLVPETSELDPSYYDGVVLIARFLIYLDLGLYEQASQLLHSQQLNLQRLDEFVLDAEKAYRSVEIKSILPYPVWTAIHENVSYVEPVNEKRFVVEFLVEGEPGRWENKDVEKIFTLKPENGEWRIVDQSGVTRNFPQTTPIRIDPAYFNGLISITKYYTDLDLGLFEEAYNLLSASIQARRDKDEFLELAPSFYLSVRITKIEPIFIFARQHSYNTPTPETGDIRSFYVCIIPEGEGGMSGSALNGVVLSQFISLIQENSDWKIDSFATSP